MERVPEGSSDLADGEPLKDSAASTDFDVFYAENRDQIARALSLSLRNPDLGAEAADEAFVRACQRWVEVSEAKILQETLLREDSKESQRQNQKSIRGATMRTRDLFISYGIFAIALIALYQYRSVERQESMREAEIRSQSMNDSMDRIIEKSNVVLKILEETQADLEKTSKDLDEVRSILETRNKNEK